VRDTLTKTMFRASVEHQYFLVAEVLLQVGDVITDGILQPESDGDRVSVSADRPGARYHELEAVSFCSGSRAGDSSREKTTK
jgi:hypothetical protein